MLGVSVTMGEGEQTCDDHPHGCLGVLFTSFLWLVWMEWSKVEFAENYLFSGQFYPSYIIFDHIH